MRKFSLSRNLLLTVLCSLLLARAALAVLPPEVYRERIRNSEIKAIAEVVEVKVLESSDTSISKRVIFRLQHSLGPGHPGETFAGHCESRGKRELVGGTIYYTPAPGQRVYVTLDKPDGSFTSYTVLTPELEEALLKHPERVKPGIGTVFLAEE